MADFKTILVKDSIIGDITSDIDFAVMSGASQTTYQRFPSTSSSNSSIIFNVQVPSENVVLGRDILINTPLQASFTLVYDPAAGSTVAGLVVAQYGQNFSLQAFPLNSLFSTATCQINNTTVSINTQDVMPSILRMNDSRELYRYNSTTPSLPDQAYFNYSDAQFSNNNPLSTYNNSSYDLDQIPRGSFPAVITLGHFGVTNNAPAGGLPSGSTIYLNDSPISAGAETIGGFAYTFALEYWTVNFQTIITEPLFLSPWIWGNPEFNSQGLLGINNMSFTLTVDATAKRLFSVVPQEDVYMNPTGTATQVGTYTPLGTGLPQLGVQTIISINNTGSATPGVTLMSSSPNAFAFSTSPSGSTLGVIQPATSPVILFKFLSTQPSDLIQTKNIVPYHDYPRYLSSQANNVAVTAGTNSLTLTSNNLQINQIPDMFIITVRKQMANQNAYDAMAQLVINNISVNLNNQSGLLSSASQYDLWRLSERNGSSQSFAEFCGQQYIQNGLTYPVAGVGTGTTGLIATTGSVLVLNPAYDLSLPDYITCGSLGNYNFQFNINVAYQQGNQSLTNQTLQSLEIVVVCVNSGIFTTQQGVSAVYTGILTKEMVLGAKSHQQASAMTSMEVARMVGGKKMMPLTAYKGIGKSAGMMGSVSSGGLSGSQSSGAGRPAKKYC